MAAIRFQCDACQHSVVADASASGSEIRCPNCQKPLIVPNPPTMDAAANADELPPVSQGGPAPAPQPAADLPQIEGYEILAKLGEGGMGAVYRARQPMLNRVVALKVMSHRYSDDPSFVARFVREAAAAANLSHRNMVQVFTAGESNGIRFIAMEFVEGRTLSEHIRKHGRLDAREAVAVAIYVAQALQYAWNKARLIHRDIKPENVFLSYGGEVKVGDLGLAKSVGETEAVLTTTGVTVGSPHYISPEQARAAKDMDFRADIYSLGCTLFHMLTGRPPFDAEDILSIMMKHVSEAPPVISEIWPECPPSLAALLGRMLAKDRTARPASYEKLVEELVAIHDELRSSSKPSPISPVEPTKSFVAKTVPALRRKPKVMMGAAVAVAAAALACGLFWLTQMPQSPPDHKAEAPAEPATADKSVASSTAPDSSITPVAPPTLNHATRARTEMVIRREDFHLEVGTKETFRFQPARSVAGIAQYVLAEKLPSSTATVFRQSVKFDGNNLPDLLVSVSEDAISARTADLPPTQLLVHWPLPLRAGQTYEYTSPAGRITARVEGPEEVTVPAGTFRCLVCVEQVHAQDRQWENRIWHAPNTGVVKMVVDGPDGFTSNLIGKEPAVGANKTAPPALQPGQPWTNSLGMKFVPVAGTAVQFSVWETRVLDFEAFVQATSYDATENAFTLAADGWKRRGGSWRSPGFAQTAEHPVSCVSWNDAKAFCKWLTGKERGEGRLRADHEYRLPTDVEWSVVLGLTGEMGGTPREKGAKNKDVYPWGSQWPPPGGAGNYAGEEAKNADWSGLPVISGYNDGYLRTSPVGSFNANQFGLHDLSGNVWEWCEDWYDTNQKNRVSRGGSWMSSNTPVFLPSSCRMSLSPDSRGACYGFRVVLAGGGVSAPQAQSGAASTAAGSPAAIPSTTAVPVVGSSSPVDAKQSQSQGEKNLTLDLGNKVAMNLALIPAGKFLMGSPEGEDVRRRDEAQHGVTLSKPFYMGVHHITVDQFAAFVKESGYKTDAEKEGCSESAEIKNGKLVTGKGKNIKFIPKKMVGASWRNPGFQQKGDHPVVQVSWNDAVAFCGWLSKMSGRAVALPTEAQWEYACRAGTKTAWPWGDNPDDGKGWANGADQSLMRILPRNAAITCFNWDDGFVFTSPVGSFKANAFGLFDMIGNAAHWCQDRYGDYEKGAVTDPTGSATGTNRVVRGGSWNNFQIKNCRSAARYQFAPDHRNDRYGFRVVAVENSSTSAVPVANVSVAVAPGTTSSSPVITAAPEKLWTNSLGMRFVPVPGTQAMFCIWKTRVRDFEAFVQATGYDATQGASTLAVDGWKQRGGSWKSPGFEQTAEHPVCCVSWDDAKVFCKWLTEKERAAGRLRADQEYRLPTDAEWSVAVGLENEMDQTPKDKSGKIENVYPWGSEWPPPAGAGNYGGEESRTPNRPSAFGTLTGYRDGYPCASPVGSFKANRFGLYDLGGNLWEWCEELFDGQSGKRALRGASWAYFLGPGRVTLLSSFRYQATSDLRQGIIGFRCVLASISASVPEAQTGAASTAAGSSAPPLAAVASPPTPQPSHQWTNSLGMKFVPVPGTSVLFSIWETRMQDFEAFVNATGHDATQGVRTLSADGWKERGGSWKMPGFVQTGEHPVCCMSWDDAKTFCTWLTHKERSEGQLRATQEYRLPTDAEWSMAVGLEGETGQTPKDKHAKIKDMYPWGSQWPPPTGVGNFAGEEVHDTNWPSGLSVIKGYRDGYAGTAPVGSFAANRYGLYNLSGNVWEWCEDWFDADQKHRALRGGDWLSNCPADLLSSRRAGVWPNGRLNGIGFRVVLAGGGVSAPR